MLSRNGTIFLFPECKIESRKHGSIDSTVKTVAYLRVSTAQQDAGSQRLAILEYARRQGFRIDDFIEATASARTSAKRRRLDQLMAVLEPGDRLVVSELSRLGRSLGEVVALLDAIAKASVAFVAVKENIRFEGRQDLQTKVMTTLFALFAEVERDLISERTREGLAKARASGKKLGRPKGSLGVSRLDGREDEIRHFLNLGVSKSSIAKITGVTRPTLYNFIATLPLTRQPSTLHECCRYPHHGRGGAAPLRLPRREARRGGMETAKNGTDDKRRMIWDSTRERLMQTSCHRVPEPSARAREGDHSDGRKNQ